MLPFKAPLRGWTVTMLLSQGFTLGYRAAFPPGSLIPAMIQCEKVA